MPVHASGFNRHLFGAAATTKRSSRRATRTRWRLKRLISVCLLLIGVIPALSGLVVIYQASKEEMTKSNGRHFMEVASLAARQIETTLGEKLTTAQWLASLPAVRNLLLFPDAGMEDINTFRRLIMPEFSSRYFVANLYDAADNPIFIGRPGRAYEPLPHLPDNFAQSHLPWIRLHKDRLEGENEYRISFYIPVLSDKNAYLGLLQTSYLIAPLFEPIRSLHMGETGDSNLVTSNGSVIFCSRSNKVEHKLAPSLVERFSVNEMGWLSSDDTIHGFTKGLIGYSAINLSRTTKLHPDSLQHLRWFIFTTQNPLETAVPLNAFRYRVGLYGIGITLFALLIGALAFRLIHNAQKNHDSELIHRATSNTVRRLLQSHQRIAKRTLDQFTALMREDMQAQHPGGESHNRRMRILKVENGLTHMSSALEHLSYFAQTHPLKKKPFDIDKLARETVQLLAYLTEKKTIQLRVTSPEKMVLVEGDQRLLSLTLMNLIMNATQAIEGDQGMIHITIASEKNGFVTLRVADNGIGIEESRIDKIFVPYVTTHEKPSQHGLGLATAAGIVEAHRGEISVSSVLNEGTEITLTLPAAGQSTLSS